jgi:hypothetical protein
MFKKSANGIPESESKIAVLTTELKKIHQAEVRETDNLYNLLVIAPEQESHAAGESALNDEDYTATPLSTRTEFVELRIRGLRERRRQILTDIATEAATIKRLEAKGRRTVAETLDAKTEALLNQASEIQNVKFIPDREIHEIGAAWLGNIKTWKLTVSEELRAEADHLDKQAAETEAEPFKECGGMRLELDPDAPMTPSSPLLTDWAAGLCESDPVLALMQTAVRLPVEMIGPDPRETIEWTMREASRLVEERRRWARLPHPLPPGRWIFTIAWSKDGRLDPAASSARFEATPRTELAHA